jgi:2-polyprenyl-3-methyl-5-hydroxy-6-metoxy-1,4-benzoquinol methylase
MPFMFGIPDMSRRSIQREMMDDHSTDEGMLYRTLGQFAFINRCISRTHVLFRRVFYSDMKKRGLSRVTVMDIGAGGGHFARWCVGFLKRRGIAPRLICIDNDQRVIGYLRHACEDFPEIEIVNASALKPVAAAGRADYVVATHLLHHFNDESIPEVITGAFEAARYGLLINDLVRHPLAYMGFSLLAGVFFRRGFTLSDGLLSIKKGFTSEEVRRYILRAGLAGRVAVGRSALGHVYLHAVK